MLGVGLLGIEASKGKFEIKYILACITIRYLRVPSTYMKTVQIK